MNVGQQNAQVPLGTTCTPTEPGLPPVPVVPGMSCQWMPSFTPPSFVVTGGQLQPLYVNNRLVCQ